MRGQLVRHCANALGRQAVGASGKTPHDVGEEARRHAQAAVEEDAPQKWLEEALYDLRREAFCLSHMEL